MQMMRGPDWNDMEIALEEYKRDPNILRRRRWTGCLVVVGIFVGITAYLTLTSLF